MFPRGLALMLLAKLVGGCESRGGGQDPADAARSSDAGPGTEPGRDGGRGAARVRRQTSLMPGLPIPVTPAATPPASTPRPLTRRTPGKATLRLRPGNYSAAVIPGGLDRLVIVKSDPGRQLCFRLTLRAPDTESVLPLRLPDTWTVESAGATAGTGAGGCAPGTLPPPVVTAASGASGSVSWTGALPCPIDVEVTLRFNAPGLPPEEILRARTLTPSGC